MKFQKKNQFVNVFYDRSNKLTLKNKKYRQQINILFNFLLYADEVFRDIESRMLVSTKKKKAFIITKETGVVAGVEEIKYYFEKKGLKIIQHKKDGDKITPGDRILYIEGLASDIVRFERTILNVLQRLSGIATKTRYCVSLAGSKTAIAATRKTHWGWLDKKAVFVGGGLTHRLSLSDGILIKKNYWQLYGTTLMRSLDSGHFQKLLNLIKRLNIEAFEIEVQSASEAMFVSKQYIKAGIKPALIIMLDNFTPTEISKTISNFKKSYGNNFPNFFELSGGINQFNLKDYVKIGVDVISLGSLTHSSYALDIALKIV